MREEQEVLEHHPDRPSLGRDMTAPAASSSITPSSAIVPSAGGSKPAMDETSVDFPEPFGPSKRHRLTWRRLERRPDLERPDGRP